MYSVNLCTFLLVLSLKYLSGHGKVMPTNCSDMLIAADQAVDHMLMLVHKDELGYANKEEFDRDYCRPFPDWLKIARSYKPCMKAFPAQLYGLVVSSIRKTWKSVCNNDEKRAETYSHLRCLTPETKPEHIKVGMAIVAMSKFVSSLEDLDDGIPGLCCGTKILLNRSTDKLEAICSKIGYKGSGKWLAEMAYSVTVDALDMICGGYQTLEDCHRKKPQLMIQVNESVRDDVEFNHTFVIPIVKLINRLDGQITFDQDEH